MVHLPLLIRLVALAVVLLAAGFDLRYRRIPNWLNLAGIILGFALNLAFFHWHGALAALGGLLFAAAIYLPLYLLRGMGAGDVKLMAALGALAGPAGWLQILIATSLIAGCAAVVYTALKGRFTGLCCNLFFMVKDLACFRAPHLTNPQLDFRHAGALRMPHGFLIALACVALVVTGYAAPKLLSFVSL